MSSEEPKSSTEMAPETTSTSMSTGTNKKKPRSVIRAEKNAAADELLASAGSSHGVSDLKLAPKGLEKLGEELTDDQLQVLNAILEDAHPEPEAENRRSVFRKLYKTFERSGIGHSKEDERRFYNIIKDPQFMEIVHVTGRGLVGTRVLKILDKLCNMAEDGDIQAADRVLQVAGFLKGKYDYYNEDVNNRRPGINIGEINFGEKSDKELAGIVNGLVDVTDSAEIIG